MREILYYFVQKELKMSYEEVFKHNQFFVLIGELNQFDETTITITMKLKGKGDFELTDNTLLPFLRKTHGQFIEKKIKKVILDLHELEFFNSQGVKAIIDWISLVKKESEENQYNIEVVFDLNLAWQKKIVTPITSFAANIIKIKN